MTVMRVLLFVLHVCMLRVCEGDDNAGVGGGGGGGGAVGVTAGHVGGTRGSGIVSSAAGVLGISVVRGMRDVGGVCEMCMCLARGGVSGREDWIWALPILWKQGECLYLCLGCGGVGGELLGAWTMVWRDGAVLCLCESGFFV